MNYYNEHDPFAAAWLRELILAGHIGFGVVDERSIEDVTPADLDGFTQCHFFAGIGVWSHALRRAGWDDSRPVWTGSCPCQPFSAAGKRGGTADERHLWPAWFHLIEQCRPGVVFGEQVEAYDWLDLVQSDLEGAGYTVGAVGLAAGGFGAPHIRQRLFFVADSKHDGSFATTKRSGIGAGEDDWRVQQFEGRGTPGHWSDCDWLPCRDGKWRPVEPGSFPLAHGSPARVGRLRGYGNAIVAQVAEAFIGAYLEK